MHKITQEGFDQLVARHGRTLVELASGVGSFRKLLQSECLCPTHGLHLAIQYDQLLQPCLQREGISEKAVMEVSQTLDELIAGEMAERSLEREENENKGKGKG